MEHFVTPKNKWSELNIDGLVVKETEQNEKHLVYIVFHRWLGFLWFILPTLGSSRLTWKYPELKFSLCKKILEFFGVFLYSLICASQLYWQFSSVTFQQCFPQYLPINNARSNIRACDVSQEHFPLLQALNSLLYPRKRCE